MNKYKCICSQGIFTRNQEYLIYKHDLINPYTKIKDRSMYTYGDFINKKEIVFFKTDDEGKMLYIENNIIILIRQDLWRERQIDKILKNE